MTDGFPHTRRPLPWILAVFLGMVFVVPIDATIVKVHLPVNSQIDRFAVLIIIMLWCFLRGDQPSIWRGPRSKRFVCAVAIFIALLVASVLGGSARIIRLDEWTLSQKEIALVASFFVMGWFALSALRPSDLKGFTTYLIWLGVIFAVGVLVESRTGYNVFYSVSRTVLSPIATVGPSPTQLNGALTDDGRVVVVGSTEHGLAAVTVLASVMGFTLIRMLDAPTRRSWWLHALAFALMVAAAIATQKKTAFVVLVVLALFVGLHRPRKFVRLLPLGLVLLAFVHVAAPGSTGTVLNPSLWFDSSSTAHRSNDLSSIWPDVVAHPLIGRGYGSVNVDQPDQFRILDNQLFSILWQMGVLGLISFIWMILAPITDAWRARRSPDLALAHTAIGASAGCLAFLVLNVLFDTFTYSEAPYMFFTLAAFCVVASGAPAQAPGRGGEPRVSRPAQRAVVRV